MDRSCDDEGARKTKDIKNPTSSLLREASKVTRHHKNSDLKEKREKLL
jgi:hypothetical protein